jgi:hypothetical protein
MTQVPLDTTADEYARLVVQPPRNELSLGSNPDAFVGVKLLSSGGQAYLGAGDEFTAASQLDSVFGAMFTGLPLLLGGTRWWFGGGYGEGLGIVASGAFGTLAVMSAIAPSPSGAPGNTMIDGASGVTVTTPAALALSVGAFATLSGGAFATINSVVGTTDFGALSASLGGGLSTRPSRQS